MSHREIILKCLAEQIGPSFSVDGGTLAEMGADSFDGVELQMQIEDALNVEIPDPDIGFRALMDLSVDQFIDFAMGHVKTVPDEL